MRHYFIVVCLLFISKNSIAQDILGKWNGKLESVQFVFTFDKIGNDYFATIDIPSQRMSGIKPKSTSFSDGKLFVDVSNIGITYKSTLDVDSGQLIGTLAEGGNEFPLTLSRGDVAAIEKRIRPQEPNKPYPYFEEEITFKNEKEKITLAGTLTMPKGEGKYPVAVLITVSGPQDRDQTFSGHKTFWVLADHLTRNGFAVLRYDDRGFGKSTGNFSEATSYDFSNDVLSAVEYLKARPDIDTNKIGLIGHSEGGIIAPLAANRSKDVAFIVLLASTGISGSDLSVMQSIAQRQFPVPDERAYEKAIRKAIKIASQKRDILAIRSQLKNHYYETIVPILKPLIGSDDKISQLITGLVEARTTKWIRYFYSYNPAVEIEKLKIPVLYLIGSNDKQVAPELNKNGVKKALIGGSNKDYAVIELEGLNHLLQESESGEIEEYSEIEQTISPMALKEISSWLLAR